MIISPQHPLLALSSDFCELCKPLEQFGLHHITFQKQYNNGSRIALSNKPGWIADYYNLELYDTSLFEKPAEIYQPEHKIWLGEFDLPVYQHGKNYYNSTSSITITEPQKDGCEFYFFAASPENEKAIHFLANNLEILHHFILYWRDSGSKLLIKAQKHRFILPRPAGFLTPKEKIILEEHKIQSFYQAAKSKFFQTTRIYKYIFDQGEYAGIKLTAREIDCIHFLLQNKTAEETAHQMHVTRRTVEFYLDNIRIKLNCKSKMELIKKLMPYKMLVALR